MYKGPQIFFAPGLKKFRAGTAYTITNQSAHIFTCTDIMRPI
jgi:hypothetical protein